MQVEVMNHRLESYQIKNNIVVHDATLKDSLQLTRFRFKFNSILTYNQMNLALIVYYYNRVLNVDVCKINCKLLILGRLL